MNMLFSNPIDFSKTSKTLSKTFISSISEARDPNILPDIGIVENLEKYGGLTSNFDEDFNTPGYIHPIFTASNWEELKVLSLRDVINLNRVQEPCNNLVPTFCLATRLLTSKWCFQNFWDKFLFQDHYDEQNRPKSTTIHGSGSSQSFRSQQAASPSPLMSTADRYKAYLSFLEYLTSITKFGYKPYDFDTSVSYTRLSVNKDSKLSLKKVPVTVSANSVLCSADSPSQLPLSSYSLTQPIHNQQMQPELGHKSRKSSISLKIPLLDRQITGLEIKLPFSALRRASSITALSKSHESRIHFMFAVALVSEIAEGMGKVLNFKYASERNNDSLATHPGLAFQREILGGILVHQSFTPLNWTEETKPLRADGLLSAWADDAAAGLVIDRGIYRRKFGEDSHETLKNGRSVDGIVSHHLSVIRNDWIMKWFYEENWALLDQGKMEFLKGQTDETWSFFKRKGQPNPRDPWDKKPSGFFVYPFKP
jgi:hypothetical protein